MESRFQHLEALLAAIDERTGPASSGPAATGADKPLVPVWMGPGQRCPRCRGRLFWDVDLLGAVPAEPACMACGWRPTRTRDGR